MSEFVAIKPWPKYGGIYFVESAGFIKIGHARDIYARLMVVQSGCPFEVRLIAEVDGTHGEEQALHRVFEDDWVRGEWHRSSERLVSTIERILRGDWDGVRRELEVRPWMSEAEKRRISRAKAKKGSP